MKKDGFVTKIFRFAAQNVGLIKLLKSHLSHLMFTAVKIAGLNVTGNFIGRHSKECPINFANLNYHCTGNKSKVDELINDRWA